MILVKRLFIILILCSQAMLMCAQLNVQASRELLQRIVPAHASQFSIESVKPENGKDVFEVESKGAKIILRGNTGVAVASALYYYLDKYCHAQITWNGTNLSLPKVLPRVTDKIHKNTPY